MRVFITGGFKFNGLDVLGVIITPREGKHINCIHTVMRVISFNYSIEGSK